MGFSQRSAYNQSRADFKKNSFRRITSTGQYYKRPDEPDWARAEWQVFAQKSQEVVGDWQPGRRATDPEGFKVLVRHREQIPFYSYRFLVRPGLSGWAQVMFPYAGSSMEDLKEKLQYDLYYVKNMGLLLDLAILMKTIRIVLFGHGK